MTGFAILFRFGWCHTNKQVVIPPTKCTQPRPTYRPMLHIKKELVVLGKNNQWFDESMERDKDDQQNEFRKLPKQKLEHLPKSTLKIDEIDKQTEHFKSKPGCNEQSLTNTSKLRNTKKPWDAVNHVIFMQKKDSHKCRKPCTNNTRDQTQNVHLSQPLPNKLPQHQTLMLSTNKPGCQQKNP